MIIRDLKLNTLDKQDLYFILNKYYKNKHILLDHIEVLKVKELKEVLQKYNKITKISLMSGNVKDSEGTYLVYIKKTIEFLIDRINIKEKSRIKVA